MPTAVIGVIDVSGSMGMSAQDKPGSDEMAPFTRLDLVKHSMKTVASMLNKRNAHLGVITFSSEAWVKMPLRRMNDAGVEEANRVIDEMQEGGGTHIWAGLQLAIGQAKTYAASRPNSNIHVILLTDGEPTRDWLPEDGIRSSLRRALQKLDGTRCGGVVVLCVLLCSVVWCGVVWCGVPKALLPEGNGRDVYPRVQVNGRGCVCGVRAVCKCVGCGVVCRRRCYQKAKAGMSTHGYR